MKDTLYVPAMTTVFPVNGTLKQKIKYLKTQIKELQEQKKCYDKMITDRRKAIIQLNTNG